MVKIIWKCVVLIVLVLLVYTVLDTGVLNKIFYHPEKRWIIEFYKEFRAINHLDKYGHFIMSGLMAFFLNILIDWRFVSLKYINILLGSLIIGLAFTIMEIHHYYIPNRKFEFLDLFFTYIGILIIGGSRNWVIKAKQLLSRTHTT